MAGLLNAQNRNENDSLDVSYYNDGPHVYWQDDSTALIIHYCDGDLIKEKLIVQDTLAFNGLCNDSEKIYTIIAAHPSIPQNRISEVSKIFAISDIHGEYEYFANILINAGIINRQLHWIWGDGHLVINGDIFDRGDMVTECLWLTHQLELEAQKSGGMVHFTLGNHEEMIIRGDNRYVNAKYTDGIVKKSRIPHEYLYGKDTELGRWLRSKNLMVRINDILFTHAGTPTQYIENDVSVDMINNDIRSVININPFELKFNQSAQFLLGGDGPLWYRGFFESRKDHYDKISSEELDLILARFDVKHIVVGHTGVDHIESLFDGRIYAIDIPFDELKGIEGLLWEDGDFYRIDVNGNRLEIE